MATGGIVAPDKPPFVSTPSKPPASFKSNLATTGKKNTGNLRKANNNSFNRGGGNANKIPTRAQRPSSKRMIDHSQPPVVKTHRTDKSETKSANLDDVAVSIVNQTIDQSDKGSPDNSNKKRASKQRQSDADLPAEEIYKKKQDDIVSRI